MITNAHRDVLNQPGRMESRAARVRLPRSIEVLEGEERERAIGDPLHLEDGAGLEQADQESFRLHLAYTDAYGAPAAEFTVIAGAHLRERRSPA